MSWITKLRRGHISHVIKTRIRYADIWSWFNVDVNLLNAAAEIKNPISKETKI